MPAALRSVPAALTLAALFAALGAWLGWLAAPALPADDAAVALVRAAAPGAPLTVTGRNDAVFAYDHPAGPWTWLVGDDDYNGGAVWLTTSAPSTQADTVAQFRAALAAEGWRVADDAATSGIAASRDQWSLVVYPDGTGTVSIELARAQPALVWPLVALGYVAGLAAGWLAARRLTSGPPGLRIAGWVALALLALPTVITTGDLLYDLFALPPTLTPPALWGDYLFYGLRLLTTTGIALLAAALAARPIRGIGQVKGRAA